MEKSMRTAAVCSNYALKIKEALVQMAVEDKLPMDMTCLNTDEFENILEPLVRQIVRDEDENTIPECIQVGVYYYEDETGKPVFDTDSMTEEFDFELKKLEDKFAS